MNDRHLFRVWCENKKEWEKDEVLISSKGYFANTISGVGIHHNDIAIIQRGYPKHHIIEFCTGLKDKNGKLGYHKDFIKNNYGDVFLIEWNSKECAYCLINIIYLKSGIELEYAIRYDSCSIDSELVKEWEIIGNIHQDSHLLGGK